MVSWGQMERLRPDQIDRIKEEHPIAYVPWGAIEWHSYHNPVGLDGLKAHALLEELAKDRGGIVFPTMFAGTDTIKPFKGFGHTVEHTAQTVRGLVTELLEGIADEGFRVIVLVTGHYGGGHVKVIQDAAQEFTARHPDVGLWAFPEWEILEPPFPPNHAAHGETSFLLALLPDLVDQSRLPADRLTDLDTDGVWGIDPRTATAEDGREMVKLFVERAGNRVEEMRAKYAPRG